MPCEKRANAQIAHSVFADTQANSIKPKEQFFANTKPNNMKSDIMERVLKDLLTYYLGFDDTSLEKHLKEANLATKERVETINDLKVIIYSNDHNPPHFHVKSKDLKINAKFEIETFNLLSGEISSKNLKKIEAFYLSPKGKIVLGKIWDKRK